MILDALLELDDEHEMVDGRRHPMEFVFQRLYWNYPTLDEMDCAKHTKPLEEEGEEPNNSNKYMIVVEQTFEMVCCLQHKQWSCRYMP